MYLLYLDIIFRLSCKLFSFRSKFKKKRKKETFPSACRSRHLVPLACHVELIVKLFLVFLPRFTNKFSLPCFLSPNGQSVRLVRQLEVTLGLR